MATTKIDIRPHRRYDFLHDFNIDRLKLDEGDKQETKRYDNLDKNWYCFTLDCFEHGAISFSLVIDRVNLGYYEFDRSRNVWIIGVMKEKWMTPKMALDLARERIEEYNDYLNWRDEGE